MTKLLYDCMILEMKFPRPFFPGYVCFSNVRYCASMLPCLLQCALSTAKRIYVTASATDCGNKYAAAR